MLELRRPEVGIGLGDGEELTEAATELGFRATEAADVARLARHRDCLAGADHALERFAFVQHVLLADLDQLGQFVVTLLEQDVDVRPRTGHVVLEIDQAVVQRDAVAGDHGSEDEHDDRGEIHGDPRGLTVGGVLCHRQAV